MNIIVSLLSQVARMSPSSYGEDGVGGLNTLVNQGICAVDLYTRGLTTPIHVELRPPAS